MKQYQVSSVKIFIIIAFCLLSNIALASSELVILNSKGIPEMKDCIARLEAKGARIAHVFPPCVLIGDFSSMSASLREGSDIKAIYQDKLPDDVIQGIPRDSAIGIEVWNAHFTTPATKAPILSTKELPPPQNDCRILKRQPLPMSAPSLKAPPYGGDFYDTSSYVAGKIAVGIILPESNENIENWTTAEVSKVISEIKTAMDWWAGIEPNSRCTFYYDIHTPFDGTKSVKINSEPINTSSEKIWIKQVMNLLGYTDPGQGDYEDYFYYVFDYNNNIRDMFGTHWAFTIFVADSSNDTDGSFPDNGFAYAYLGGPFMVMTYDNGNYGIDNMDSVCAHEMGHIFYALDEYLGASSKTERSGYLNVINSNHESNPKSVPCIMKGLISPFTNRQVCYYTRGQSGLWDTDNDNIIDVLDWPPQVFLTPYSPDPTSNQSPTYIGYTQVTAVPNKNPQESLPIHDITINTISDVQYQINNGSWTSTTPSDGTFDEPEEDFTFTLSGPKTLTPLPDGTYTVRVRAIDSAGNISNYATDTLTIETYNHPPNPFSLISPANTTVIGVLKPEFDWEDAIDIDPDDVVSYTLWYSKDINFATKTEVSGLPLSKYTPTDDLYPDSTYYWKVYAVDKDGNKTWSKQTWSFSTKKITIVVIGTVTDTQGIPISDAIIQARLNTVVNGSATSNPDGIYKITLFALGDYIVSASKNGFFSANTITTLGSLTNYIDFQLKKMPDEASNVSVSPGTHSMSIFETHILTAEVTDKNGERVVDGTLVIWQASNGIIDPKISSTINGIATSTYIAPALSGIATITAIASSTMMPRGLAQVTIGVGMPYRLELLPRQATVQAGKTRSFTVQAYDRSWQEISGLEYYWDIDTGLGTLSQVNGTTNTFIAGGQLGTGTIVVNAASMTAVAKIDIIPGGLHRIVITPETSTVKVGNDIGFVALGYDQYNNPIPNLEYSWQVSPQLGSLTLAVGSSTRFIAGTVPGTLTINALSGTITGYTDIAIISDGLHHIVIEPLGIVELQVETQQVFYAAGYDQYNNYLPEILFDWAIDDNLGDISPLQGTKTTLTAGRFIINGKITASNSGVSGYTSVRITPGELGYFQFNDIDNQQAGKEFTITITARDKDGNIINNYNEPVVLSDTINTIYPSVNFMDGVWTGTISITNAAYSITIQAEEENGKIGISNRFDVLPARVSWVEIIPTYQEVMVSQTTTVLAKGYDQYNNQVPDALFSWMIIPSTLGNIGTNTGIFTAGTRTGTLSLIALSNNQRAIATIRIVPGMLDHFDFSNIPHQAVGKGFPISIIAHDRYHNLIDTFIDEVDILYSTGSIMPQHSGAFTNGLWNGTVTINNLMLGLNIAARYQGLIKGRSNQFSVLVDDDIGNTSTIGSITVQFDKGSMNGIDYYPLITPDASSIYIERANIELHQYPWVKQIITIGVNLVDGNNNLLAQGVNTPATMSVPYQGMFPDAKNNIQIYQLDGDKWRHLLVQPQVDLVNHRVWFAIPYAGTYTLTIHEAQPNLDDLVVYPVPFKRASGDTHIIFKGLTEDTVILIYDMAGDIIRKQEHVSTEWRWAVIDEGVYTGVYFYVVIDNKNRKRVGKIVIIQ